MSEFLPDGEGLRRALAWIGLQRQEASTAPLAILIDEASKRFDLGPMDEEFLFRTLARSAATAPSDPAGQ